MDTDCLFHSGGECLNKGSRNSTPSLNSSCQGQQSYNDYGCVTIDNEAGNKIPPLIDNETKHLLELYINVVGFILTSSLGVVGNCVNIIVYWKQGLGDSISLGFFALSVSDLILVAMPLFTGSLYAAKYVLQDSPIDFSSIHYVSFGWVRNFTYSCSLLITAFLSLERCCCIVLPFKVQTLFTRKKTTIFLIVMFLFHAVCICLLPFIVQLKWQGSSNNTKRLRVKFSDFGREMEVFYSTSMSFIVPVGCQIIVTVCAFVMIRGLRKASRFRAQATSAGGGGNIRTENVMTVTSSREKAQNKHPEESFGNKIDFDSKLATNNQKRVVKNSEKDQSGSGNSNNSSTLSQRDARLVKAMIFIVSILSACNIPFLAATFAWRLVPDLNIGKPYANTLSVVFSVVYILGNLNASVNVIVYYKTSSRFREVTKELFSRRKKK